MMLFLRNSNTEQRNFAKQLEKGVINYTRDYKRAQERADMMEKSSVKRKEKKNEDYKRLMSFGRA